MKIEPTEKYDQEVFSFLKEIKYLLKRNEGNQVTYHDRYKPHNKNFWKIQFLVDKLSKKEVFEVVDVIDVKGGTNPDYHNIDFILKVNRPAFDDLYEQYKTVFENHNKDTLIVNSKTGDYEFRVGGKVYKSNLSLASNSFTALLLLATHSGEELKYKDIDKVLDRHKPHSSTTEKERVKEALKYAKKKLKYRGNKLFKPLYYGVRLLPRVEIIRSK